MILRRVDDGVGGAEVLASRKTRILMLPWWRYIDDGVGTGWCYIDDGAGGGEGSVNVPW